MDADARAHAEILRCAQDDKDTRDDKRARGGKQVRGMDRATTESGNKGAR